MHDLRLFYARRSPRLRKGAKWVDLPFHPQPRLLLLCTSYVIVTTRSVPPSLGAMPIERWTVVSRNGEAGWCGRRKHQVVSHRGSLFLLGGFTSGGVLGTAGAGRNANLHDVWKSTEGAVRAVFCAILSPSFLPLGCCVHHKGIFFCSCNSGIHRLHVLVQQRHCCTSLLLLTGQATHTTKARMDTTGARRSVIIFRTGQGQER